jgi:hypothetical protein
MGDAMKVAYFDCFAGAGGDMIVGALIDAGCDFAALKAELAKLGIPGCSLWTEKVNRAGLAGVKFNIKFDQAHQPRRHLSDIVSLIDRANLSARAADLARSAFTRLGRAEAKAHRIDVEEVHFHEVGAMDSILDIVGACVATDLLGIEAVECSPIPVGSGMIKSDHGAMPVPAPATAELLAGVPIAAADVQGEATTPTAAAVLTTLAQSYGPLPPMLINAVGYGAGSRDSKDIPNLLRVFVGELDQGGTADSAVELSANIDDCTGEVLGATIGKLLSAGCLDAWACPAVMKKSRPAWVLSVLCSPADVEAAQGIIFSETTTFGIRRRACQRSKLLRSQETVETAYGPIRIKVGRSGNGEVTASPEFEDCLAAATTHNVPVKEVLMAAQESYRRRSRT